jgi:hypothetical protein
VGWNAAIRTVVSIIAVTKRALGWRVGAGRLLAVLLAAVAVPLAPAAAQPEPFTTSDVTFVGAGGVILHGIVVAPRPDGRPRPALVMLEGAGNRGRQELQPGAEAFARRGVITLIYDKRKVGYSVLRRDYGLLADDAIAAVALLATRRDVDPARLGLWAQSEGAYVAPLACRRSSAIKFMITVGAVGVTPAVQTAWGYEQFLRHAGVGSALPHTLKITALRTMISAGLFPEAHFDPIPAWQQVRQPVLAEWVSSTGLPSPGRAVRPSRTHSAAEEIPDTRCASSTAFATTCISPRTTASTGSHHYRPTTAPTNATGWMTSHRRSPRDWVLHLSPRQHPQL